MSRLASVHGPLVLASTPRSRPRHQAHCVTSVASADRERAGAVEHRALQGSLALGPSATVKLVVSAVVTAEATFGGEHCLANRVAWKSILRLEEHLSNRDEGRERRPADSLALAVGFACSTSPRSLASGSRGNFRVAKRNSGTRSNTVTSGRGSSGPPNVSAVPDCT